ncbi:MAG: S26 family signal peptidase [Firmicutes bacterium]|nr:S26 family signal peptidase [Bacillota bacterium]
MARKRGFVSQEYSAEHHGRDLKEGTRRGRILTIVASSIFGVSALVGVGLVTFTIIFFLAAVTGQSMMMSLNASGANTDSVLVNRFRSPERGDIIVVRHTLTTGETVLHIKRLVAIDGEWVHFERCLYEGRFIITVDGVEHDNNHPGFTYLFGNNVHHNSTHYFNDFWTYQQTGIPPFSFSVTYRFRDIHNNPGFNRTTEDGEYFRRWNYERERFEMYIPQGYMFYLGDHRGGRGTAAELSQMSIDSAYFGPQPTSILSGVVQEKIPNQTATNWFFDTLWHYISFRWLWGR